MKGVAEKLKLYEYDSIRNKTQLGKSTKKNYNRKLPWFDQECKRKRTNYRKCVRLHKLRQTSLNFENRRKAHAAYKRTLNSTYNRYIKRTNDRIRTLRSSDPRSYWKIVSGNKQGRNSVVDKIAHEVFQEHFEKLSNVPEEELFETVLDETKVVINSKLNEEIMPEEVLRSIRRLKNNKSPVQDGILNELFKVSSSKLLNVLTLLFNVILIVVKFQCRGH